MGRPKKEINEKQVERLAAIGCTVTEIATVLGCNPDTLYVRFSESLKKGRESLKTSLRRFQYKAAQNGNAAILIWMGKQYLGQRDKIDMDVKDARQRAEAAIVSLMNETGVQRNEAIKQLSARIEGFEALASEQVQ